MLNSQITISQDKKKLDLELIYAFLLKSYWANKRTKTQILTSIENSICFGVYKKETQIGFARVITDKSTFAYLADVFIVKSEQGQGYAQVLMKEILSDNALIGITNWYLITKDAQSLYEKLGFTNYCDPKKIVMHLLL